MSDRAIKRGMLVTDVGFILYWVANAVGVIPPYRHAVLDAWNWSFLTLDLLAAATGLLSLSSAFAGGGVLRVVSLALTHAAGLLALSFWTIRGEFDLAWWLPNLWLAIFPVVALASLMRAAVGPKGSACSPGSS